MMGMKQRSFAPLVNVSLEELVPQDHFYRHLERSLDLSFVREFVQQTYAGGGRPSIDPVVFFKLQLVMFFEGIRSERQLMRHAEDRLSVRWYLGYDLDESLPDHSSLTRIRTRYGVEVFRRFFEAIVDQCQQAGLVWGKELYADATKVQANAALSSMKPRFAVEAHLAVLFAQEADEHEEAKEEAIQHGNGLEQEAADGRLDSPVACLPSTTPEGVDELVEPSLPRQLPTVLDEALQEDLTTLNSERHDWIERLGEPDRSLIRGKYRRMADFWVSTTDPDATMMNSKGEGTRLGYHTHYVVDGGKARIIMAVLVTPSEVMENQPVLDLLWRVRFRWKLWPRQFTGDTTMGRQKLSMPLNSSGFVPTFLFQTFINVQSSSDNVTSAMMRNATSISVQMRLNCICCPQGVQINSSSTEQRPAYAMPVHLSHGVPRAKQDAGSVALWQKKRLNACEPSTKRTHTRKRSTNEKSG
jgi:transposase